MDYFGSNICHKRKQLGNILPFFILYVLLYGSLQVTATVQIRTTERTYTVHVGFRISLVRSFVGKITTNCNTYW